MKLKLATTLLTALILTCPLILPAEEAKGSQVILDWDKFVKLWEDAAKPVKLPDLPPPVDYILSSAHYESAIRPETSEAKATFKLNVLEEKKWVKIPFLPASLGLKEAFLDGKSVPVAQDNGYHSLITKGAAHTARVLTMVKALHLIKASKFCFKKPSS